MVKPTIFFSHSSRDANVLNIIKTRLCKITSNVVNVFLSSDGESIPFGHNWVHKIDEALQTASAMFVFITPNSINSSWIYFEAGYAYAKGIKVIPVGLGTDITLLRPPLNLLQGFNILSGDGLNNLIAVINDIFALKFPESFNYEDYITISSSIGEIGTSMIAGLFSRVRFEIWQSNEKQETEDDIRMLFDNSIAVANELKIPYSKGKNGYNNNDSMLLLGLQITHVAPKTSENRLSINVSPYNMGKSLAFIKRWLENTKREQSYLHFYPSDSIVMIKSKEEISSLIYEHLCDFSVDQENMGHYLYKSVGFSVFDASWSGKMEEWVISVSYNIQTSTYDDFLELFERLIEVGIIKYI